MIIRFICYLIPEIVFGSIKAQKFYMIFINLTYINKVMSVYLAFLFTVFLTTSIFQIFLKALTQN